MKNLILIFYLIFLIATHSTAVACGGNQTNGGDTNSNKTGYTNQAAKYEEAASCDLIRLVSMGSISGVKALLGAGKCDVNYVNDEGDTALMVAARRNDQEMIQILIEHGANINAGMGREYLIRHANIYHNQVMLNLVTGISDSSFQ